MQDPIKRRNCQDGKHRCSQGKDYRIFCISAKDRHRQRNTQKAIVGKNGTKAHHACGLFILLHLHHWGGNEEHAQNHSQADYGRASMVKAGYSGSRLNDVIWMGDVVNSACHIANKAGRGGKSPIIVSSVVYSNLNEDNQKLLGSTIIDSTTYYGRNIVNTHMNDWYEENCK